MSIGKSPVVKTTIACSHNRHKIYFYYKITREFECHDVFKFQSNWWKILGGGEYCDFEQMNVTFLVIEIFKSNFKMIISSNLLIIRYRCDFWNCLWICNPKSENIQVVLFKIISVLKICICWKWQRIFEKWIVSHLASLSTFDINFTNLEYWSGRLSNRVL